MLKTCVDNSTKELGLEQKVLETGRVDTHVVPLFAIRFGSTGSGVLGNSGDFLFICRLMMQRNKCHVSEIFQRVRLFLIRLKGKSQAKDSVKQ